MFVCLQNSYFDKHPLKTCETWTPYILGCRGPLDLCYNAVDVNLISKWLTSRKRNNEVFEVQNSKFKFGFFELFLFSYPTHPTVWRSSRIHLQNKGNARLFIIAFVWLKFQSHPVRLLHPPAPFLDFDIPTLWLHLDWYIDTHYYRRLNIAINYNEYVPSDKQSVKSDT